MLIVNADDYGFSAAVTDLTLRAHDEGLISSASAMVWMTDSERAAQLARDRAMPLGLHLNFTLPFRDQTAPPEARDLQELLTRMFDKASWREEDQVHSLALVPGIRDAIDHQLEAFRMVYGEPTHIDGHHHVHVHPAVLVCLPREFAVRPVIRAAAELDRRSTARDRLISSRFRAADACVSFRHIHPALGGSGLGLLEFARTHTLEVMVHPREEDEQEALRAPEWIDAMSSLTVGSYRDLGARAR